MADDSGIDPRYAAQFQRGFDPARHHAAPVAPRPREAADTPVRLPGGPAKAAQRVDETPRARTATVSAAPVEAGADPSAEAETDENRARPVVEWVLLGMSGLLLVVAGWLFARQVEMNGTGFGPGGDGVLQYLLASTLPGPLIVGGVVGVLAWIGLRAAFPQPRGS